MFELENCFFLKSLLINLPVRIICIGKIIRLNLGKIKKNENTKIFDKYINVIKFKSFECLIEISIPINELILIIIKGKKYKG